MNLGWLQPVMNPGLGKTHSSAISKSRIITVMPMSGMVRAASGLFLNNACVGPSWMYLGKLQYRLAFRHRMTSIVVITSVWVTLMWVSALAGASIQPKLSYAMLLSVAISPWLLKQWSLSSRSIQWVKIATALSICAMALRLRQSVQSIRAVKSCWLLALLGACRFWSALVLEQPRI